MHRHWIDAARADLRREGPAQFWFAWASGSRELREAAYTFGRFTPAARRVLDQRVVVQVPTGVAWLGAVAGVYLVPRWIPGGGALPSTPWIGAACLRPLPLIAGVAAALTPQVLAHEFAHVIWPKLPRKLREGFPMVLRDLERDSPELTAWLDECLSGYKDLRSPDECHVRLLERHQYGRQPLPLPLRPYYQGWVED